jgi:hypothetical protein
VSRLHSNSNESRHVAERAYVATRYVLGARQSQLLAGLFEPGPPTRKLAQALGHRDRTERAQLLALDLRPIIEALDDMQVSRC